MQNKNDDDQRTVTVTVAKLKAFEGAVIDRASARIRKERAGDAADKARLALEQAVRDEIVASSLEIAATKALYEDEGKQ